MLNCKTNLRKILNVCDNLCGLFNYLKPSGNYTYHLI
jgi:hypothetical protein